MPATTLVETTGAANANTYATLAEANTYHDDRTADAADTWAAGTTTDDIKNKALLTAARWLDALFVWTGSIVDGTQVLLWPRVGMLERSAQYIITETTIPQELKDAQAEFALALIIDDRQADSDIETLGLTSLSAGPVSMSFKESQQAKVVPDAVANLIPRHWFTRIVGRSSGFSSLART